MTESSSTSNNSNFSHIVGNDNKQQEPRLPKIIGGDNSDFPVPHVDPLWRTGTQGRHKPIQPANRQQNREVICPTPIDNQNRETIDRITQQANIIAHCQKSDHLTQQATTIDTNPCRRQHRFPLVNHVHSVRRANTRTPIQQTDINNGSATDPQQQDLQQIPQQIRNNKNREAIKQSIAKRDTFTQSTPRTARPRLD